MLDMATSMAAKIESGSNKGVKIFIQRIGKGTMSPGLYFCKLPDVTVNV